MNLWWNNNFFPGCRRNNFRKPCVPFGNFLANVICKCLVYLQFFFLNITWLFHGIHSLIRSACLHFPSRKHLFDKIEQEFFSESLCIFFTDLRCLRWNFLYEYSMHSNWSMEREADAAYLAIIRSFLNPIWATRRTIHSTIPIAFLRQKPRRFI